MKWNQLNDNMFFSEHVVIIKIKKFLVKKTTSDRVS